MAALDKVTLVRKGVPRNMRGAVELCSIHARRAFSLEQYGEMGTLRRKEWAVALEEAHRAAESAWALKEVRRCRA